MLVQQYISEFNKISHNVEFLTYADEISLKSKIKLISSQFGNLTKYDLNHEFVSNVLKVLSSCKPDLLENCLDLIDRILRSKDRAVREIVFKDGRFFQILINNLFGLEDENRLIKLLNIIRNIIRFECELSEHDLKLTVKILKDFAENNSNPDIFKLSLNILIDLSIGRDRKNLIMRELKTSDIVSKVKSMSGTPILGFKYTILLDSEFESKDFSYFLVLSLTDVAKSIDNLDQETVRENLDVLQCIEKLNIQISFKISDSGKIMEQLDKLITDVTRKRKATENEDETVEAYFEEIFQYFKALLKFASEAEVVQLFEDFTEVAFLKTDSKSSSGLEFLRLFVASDGKLKSQERIIELLLEYFAGNDALENTDFKQKSNFLSLLEQLQIKNLLSDDHRQKVSDHFKHLIHHYENFDIRLLEEDEIYYFIHFVFVLSRFAPKNVAFYSLLCKVLKLDFLPIFVAKGHNSKRIDVVEICLKLSAAEDFPNRKIAEILARSCTRSDKFFESRASINQNNLKQNTMSYKFVAQNLYDRIENCLERVENHQDCNGNGCTFSSDVIQIYRTKLGILNEHIAAMTKSLDRLSVENAELNQRITSLQGAMEKQEFLDQCLNMDKERLQEELDKESVVIKTLKKSIIEFENKILKEGTKLRETQKQLKLKTAEIESLQEFKTKLQLLQKENDVRIKQLKEELESEKKEKSEENLRINQKLASSEKENINLKEMLKIREEEIIQNHERIKKCEEELKEVEQMRSTIFSVLSSKKF